MQRTLSDWGGNLVAFAIVILFNALSSALPINDQTMPEISAKYPSLFTPAGFTFSIWGVIYLALLVFQKADFELQMLTITVIVLFALATYYLLRKDTAEFFRSVNADKTQDSEKKI